MPSSTKNKHWAIRSDDEIKEALLKNKGIISYAAQELGMSRDTLDNRIRRNPELKETCKQAREIIIDEAEKGLFNKIASEEWGAIEFVLRRLGRIRGYGDVQDVNMNANVQADVNIDMSKLSTEELEKLDELTAKITIKSTNKEGTSEA